MVEMRCTKLQLQDRTKLVTKETINDWPRRYCERRRVDPEQEDFWANKFNKFYLNEDEDFNQTYNNSRYHQGAEELFLSVQNLQFQGEVQQRKRPRTSFKYKTLPHRQHRMFVKELVEDNWNEGANGCSERCSELTCYFYDDYAKYLLSNDRSRPSSGKSSIFPCHVIDKPKQCVNTKKKVRPKTLKTLIKSDLNKKNSNEVLNENIKDPEEKSDVKDTRISYNKSGKRKSLTISRVDSAATIQVIRVDVVCNYSSSTVSEHEDKKQTGSYEITKEKKVGKRESHLANKYLLTNAVKTLDEDAGGARVTLLCKTFKLADKSGLFVESKAKSLRMRRK